MKRQRWFSVGTRAYLKIFSVFLALCVVIAGVSMLYYRKLYDTIRQESRSYLQEVARRIGSNIDRIIDDNFAVLHTMRAVMQTADNASFEDLSAVLQLYQDQWRYQRVMLIDQQGRAFDLEGNEDFLVLDDSVRQKLISGEDSMSTAQVINNREYILFSVPVSRIQVKGRTVVALAATYDPISFDKSLTMDSFNKQAYSQIVTRSGAAITSPSTAYAINAGYNVFSTIEKSKLDSQSSFQQMQEDINHGKSDLIGFTSGDVYRYMVYTPVVSDEWYLLTFVPVKVVNEKSEMLLQTTLLICGLIAVIFAGLSAMLMLLFNKNKRHLEKLAFVDEVTGGNTIQKFYRLTDELLHTDFEKQYALVFSNISKFKVLNEQLGKATCDNMLQVFYQFLGSFLSEQECIGRLFADNFCMLVEFEDEEKLIERFKLWRSSADALLMEKMPWGLPVVTFGVYVIVDRSLSIPQMIDRAKLSVKESLWAIDNKLSYAFYDDGIRRRMFREKFLEDHMEAALKNQEFQVYLQPKYDLAKDKIGGAEALIRWVSDDGTMIYPDEFIPLFEKNGFIVQTDIWVFEQVCQKMQSWAKQGLPPLKVSVNCSRVHFKHEKFLDPYIRIAEQYNVERKYVEIEITESVVFENSDLLIKIIDQIKDAGFCCSMDDFGSGYSSLNLIQTIPVDTLKLDKSFFMKNVGNINRIEAVVKNMVGMAKALSMKTVAEGVEYPEQVMMLRQVGCDYIQGYVYAKPMSMESFEDFAFRQNVKLIGAKEQ